MSGSLEAVAAPEDELCRASAVRLARLVRERQVSPVEVAQAHLRRVVDVHDRVRALVWHDPDQVLAAARAAAQAVMDKVHLGPLHGVPFTVKELTPVAGQPHTLGLPPYRDRVARTTAPSVARLLAAGGIQLGRTNTSEAGYAPLTDNHLFGPTRNPWSLDHICGGSSGGAAAAVAAGCGPLAQATDGAGSIRIPASACGVVGMKPTFGRVAQLSAPRFSTFAVEGPITRSVADAALMLEVMAGPAAVDPLSLPAQPLEGSGAPGGLRGLRVAWSPDLGFGGVDPEVSGCAATVAQVFADLGCEVQERAPSWHDPQDCLWQALWVPAYAGLVDLLAEDVRDEVDDDLIRLIRTGAFTSARMIAHHEQQRAATLDALEALFEQVDLLVTPTLRVPPFRAGSLAPEHLLDQPAHHRALGWVLTHPFNLTGHPAVSVPGGRTAEGLPVGVQIVGRRFADADVLRAALAYEQAAPWPQFPSGPAAPGQAG